MTYAITKKFVSGILEGMEHKELTGIRFTEGKQYDNYIIVSCRPVTDNDTVQIEANRPYQHGGKQAFASGTYEYIKHVAKDWRNSGFYNIHIWAD